MAERQAFAALPVLAESENLPALIDCLKRQSFSNLTLVVCVNNYEHWWSEPQKYSYCLDNQRCIEFLSSVQDMDIHLIDHSSPGKGWPEKKGGVGWARKSAMDLASRLGNDNDLIFSIDADTFYPREYFEKVIHRFDAVPQFDGFAVPYYHQLAGDDTDRLILRYEIYMRHYLLNLLKINNPYAFTAIGSAIAVENTAYRKVGGLTPVKSGEDFYFLQKLVKNGLIGLWVETSAFPASRFSDRVLFGTGPALIKGSGGDWNSYPFYLEKSFRDIMQTFESFPKLFEGHEVTPMDDFLKAQFKGKPIWAPLRKNYRDKENFVQACIRKIDGLRLLQFLRKARAGYNERNEEILKKFIHNEKENLTFPGLPPGWEKFDFDTSKTSLLNSIRNFLNQLEQDWRRSRDERVINNGMQG